MSLVKDTKHLKLEAKSFHGIRIINTQLQSDGHTQVHFISIE